MTDPFEIEKVDKLKKEPKYTKGRAAAATILGGYHAPFAAKKGRKLRATTRSVVEGTVGGAVGSTAAAALTRGKAASLGGLAGTSTGTYHAFRENNKRGHFKKQIKKSDTASAFGIEH